MDEWVKLFAAIKKKEMKGIEITPDEAAMEVLSGGTIRHQIGGRIRKETDRVSSAMCSSARGRGDGDAAIPEGYLTVTPEGSRQPPMEIVHPYHPGSIYHMTKCLDNCMFHYYAKNDALRITELHQGIVWGAQTEETQLDPELFNRLDQDGDFGTVLNRFVIQAVQGMPLTVYGTGGQTRAFIHISDSVRCIAAALGAPPARGDRVAVYNQCTETLRVVDIASQISEQFSCSMAFVPNPRNEAASNDLTVSHAKFDGMGLCRRRLDATQLQEMFTSIRAYHERIVTDTIAPSSRWALDTSDSVSVPVTAAAAPIS